MTSSLETPRRRTRSGTAWATFAVLGGVIGVVLYVHGLPFGIRERQQVQLDPARVVVLRTPGGFLEVSTLVKAEEFRWRSSYTCPWGDCGRLLGQRIGQVRVPVHYTFRIPLAESWTLRPEGDAYVLSVPAPVPRLPPGIDMGKAEFSSERGGLLVPGRAANQESLLRNLGPELERRAQRPEYLQQQMPAADKTVQEFAQKWMKEQAAAPVRPVRVEFRMNDSN